MSTSRTELLTYGYIGDQSIKCKTVLKCHNLVIAETETLFIGGQTTYRKGVKHWWLLGAVFVMLYIEKQVEN